HRDSLERFRQFAAWRRDLLWRLAATPCLDATVVRQGNCLILNWTFAAGILSLVVNPTDATQDCACLICSRSIARGHYEQHGDVLRLGPWAAVAWVSDGT